MRNGELNRLFGFWRQGKAPDVVPDVPELTLVEDQLLATRPRDPAVWLKLSTPRVENRPWHKANGKMRAKEPTLGNTP